MKSVHFAEDCPDKQPISMPTINYHECLQTGESSLWYDKTEIKKFYNEVKNARRKRLRDSTNYHISDIDESEEYFSSPFFLSNDQAHERKRRKYHANKTILKAQHTMKESELAIVSFKLSKWARDSALGHAEKHAKMAY